MSDVQKVLIYHDPMQMALWEGGLMWPLICSMFWAVMACILVGAIINKIPYKQGRDYSWVFIVTVVVAIFGTFKFMGAL